MTGSHPLPNDATGIPGGCFLTEQYSQVSLLCRHPADVLVTHPGPAEARPRPR